MPDKKITELDALTTLSTDDLFVVVDDPSGTPVTKKITAGNVRNLGLAGGAARPLITDGARLSGSGLVLQGLSGNYASSPDSAALSITGDIDIKVKMSMTNWAPGGAINPSIVAKHDSSTTRSYWFTISTAGLLQLNTSADGSTVVTGGSSVATGFAAGATKWVRATLQVNNGSGSRVYKFYTSDDGTSWTQLGTTATVAGTTSIADTTSTLSVGARSLGTDSPNATIQRVIIQSAYDTADNTTSLVYDANFETATADALAFTESSSNTATVTINTTRYTYGVPDGSITALATTAITADTSSFAPIVVKAPMTVDMAMFEVTTAPTSTATWKGAIYAADNNMNPVGSPVVNFGSVTVATSSLVVYRKQITPVTLQPGVYLLAFNSDVAFNVRAARVTPTFVNNTMGANSMLTLLTLSQTNAAFPSSSPVPTAGSYGSGIMLAYFYLRWSAA